MRSPAQAIGEFVFEHLKELVQGLKVDCHLAWDESHSLSPFAAKPHAPRA
jgi:hypothetical protein